MSLNPNSASFSVATGAGDKFTDAVQGDVLIKSESTSPSARILIGMGGATSAAVAIGPNTLRVSNIATCNLSGPTVTALGSQAGFGSNLAVTSSNFLYSAEVPRSTFASNLAVATSNYAFAAPIVTGDTALSNFVYSTEVPRSTFASNLAVAASNSAFAAPIATGLSNFVYSTEVPRSTFASNAAAWTSNSALGKAAGGTVVGNVGLGGKTAPQYPLDVMGDINFTGTLLRNGVAETFGGFSNSTVSSRSFQSFTYPPATSLAFTSNQANLATLTGTGIYTFNSSTSLAADRAAQKAFDVVTNESWETASRYTVGGAYNGTVITAAGATNYAGEWVDVTLPVPIFVSTMRLMSGRVAVGHAARDFVLLGSSNNGTSWSLLAEFTDQLFPEGLAADSNLATPFAINSQEAFSRLRLVVTKSAYWDVVVVNYLAFEGTELSPSAACVANPNVVSVTNAMSVSGNTAFSSNVRVGGGIDFAGTLTRRGAAISDGTIVNTFVVNVGAAANSVKNVASYTDIGTNCLNFVVDMITNGSSLTMAKRYVFASFWNFNSGAWSRCAPITGGNNNPANYDYELQVRNTGSATELRVVRIAAAATISVRLRIECSYPGTRVPKVVGLAENPGYTDASWASYSYMPSATLAQYDGRVGIGIEKPLHRLDVAGDINFTGTLRSNGAPLALTDSFSSNTAVSLSNFVYTTDASRSIFSSNAAVWGSNAGVFSSNVASWSSNNLLNRNTGGVVNGSLDVAGNINYTGTLLRNGVAETFGGFSNSTVSSRSFQSFTYPPATSLAFTSNQAILATLTGTGIYTFNSSTSMDANREAQKAFDVVTNENWESASRYTSVTGVYNGTVITTAGGTNYPGEWVDVTLPVPVFVSTMRLMSGRSGNGYAARDFVLLGSSNNGTTWSLLAEFTDQVFPLGLAADSSLAASFAINSQEAFSRLRLVISKTGYWNWAVVNYLAFEGTELSPSAACVANPNVVRVTNAMSVSGNTAFSSNVRVGGGIDFAGPLTRSGAAISDGTIVNTFFVNVSSTANSVKDVASYTDVGTNCLNFVVDMITNGSSLTMAKRYVFASFWNFNSGAWSRCAPITGGNNNPTNDYELQVRNVGSATELRVVRHSSASTISVRLRIECSYPGTRVPKVIGLTQNPEYTDASWASYAYMPSAMLTQYDGRVGIGIEKPLHRLDVVGDINFTGTLRSNGAPLALTDSFSSNTAVSLSNFVYTTDAPRSIFGSNAGVFSSNVASWSSNNLLNRTTGGVITGSLTVTGGPTSDVVINPDAYNSLLVWDDQSTNTTASHTSHAFSDRDINNRYIMLTRFDGNPAASNGAISWPINPGNSFQARFEFTNWPREGYGFTFFNSLANPFTSNIRSTGYHVFLDEFNSGGNQRVVTSYNGTVLDTWDLGSPSFFGTQAWMPISVAYNRGTIAISLNNGQMNRTVADRERPAMFESSNTFVSLWAANQGTTNGGYHAVRNIRLSKLGEGAALAFAGMSNFDVTFPYGRVGIGKVPAHGLDVVGDINYTGTLRLNGTAVSLGGTTDAGNITSGTLAVARGGTGTTTSTGTGSVVLSAGPTFTGTVAAATINATTLQQGGTGVSLTGHVHSGNDITTGTIAAARLPGATTASAGIVTLTTDTNSTSTTSAATPSAVKAAMDAANACLNRANGGTVSGQTIFSTNSFSDYASSIINSFSATQQAPGLIVSGGQAGFGKIFTVSRLLTFEIMNVYANGNTQTRGSFTGGGADYAEYFEWADGNPSGEDRVGCSVVFAGDNSQFRQYSKIRIAAPGDPDGEILGVVSGNPSVVGNDAWSHWHGAVLHDSYGRAVTEDVTVVEWTHEETGELKSFVESELPQGIVVPDIATRRVFKREKMNPAYNSNIPYIQRHERKEWGVIGMLGRVRVRKGQRTSARWLCVRDVDDDVQEWIVR